MFIKEKTEMTTIQDGVELKSLLRLLYKAIAIAVGVSFKTSFINRYVFCRRLI